MPFRIRALRKEPPPGPDQLALRGILGDTGLDPADLRRNAELNYEQYGYYGVSVWVTDAAHPREWLERTSLAKFELYAEFTVTDLEKFGLELRATGQSPHYDVVRKDYDMEKLIEQLTAAPHRIQVNPSVNREEG